MTLEREGLAPKRLYSLAQAADYLGCSQRTVQRLVAANTLPVKYMPVAESQARPKPVFEVRDLDAYIDALPSERTAS